MLLALAIPLANAASAVVVKILRSVVIVVFDYLSLRFQWA
jgi:hypothetical protein